MPKARKRRRKGRVVLVFIYPEQDLGRVTSEARACGLAPMPEGEHGVNIREVNLMSIVSPAQIEHVMIISDLGS